MSSQLKPNNANYLTITLEVMPESLQDADPAMVDAVGRDTVDSVRKDGYGIAPVYTGQRGGFVIDVLIPALTTVWAQKDAILADGSALVTIFTPVVLVAQHLYEAHKRRKGNIAMQQIPIKITAEIDGATISIETSDLEAAEAAIKLARRFQAQHSVVASRVNSQSRIKLKGSIAKSPHRKRQ